MPAICADNPYLGRETINSILPPVSEDCLYLNVWTAAQSAGERRPVMVWIYGGVLERASVMPSTYDGEELAKKGVVLVTFNYRVGIFGLLAHPELSRESIHHTSGNYWFLDQLAALEWVRDEIAAFGGDPGNVTVFGESAGSVNIACLLTMSRARGLFHRAILQSGSLNLTRPPSMALDVARQLLAEVGLAPEHAHRLRDVPAKDLMAATNAVAGRSVIPPFSPVADGELIPARLRSRPSPKGRPVALLLLPTKLAKNNLFCSHTPFFRRLEEAALLKRSGLLFPGTGPDGRALAERAVDTYRSARRARGEDASAVETWLAISTDHVFRAGALKLAELHARHTPEVFVYQFEWKGRSPGRPQGPSTLSSCPRVRYAGDVGDRGDRAAPGGADLSGRCRTPDRSVGRAAPRRRASGVAAPAAPRRATMVLGSARARRCPGAGAGGGRVPDDSRAQRPCPASCRSRAPNVAIPRETYHVHLTGGPRARPFTTPRAGVQRENGRDRVRQPQDVARVVANAARRPVANPGPRRRGRACSRADLEGQRDTGGRAPEPSSANPVLGGRGFDDEVHRPQRPIKVCLPCARPRDSAEREPFVAREGVPQPVPVSWRARPAGRIDAARPGERGP
jgi:carboxylesterase type B